MAHGSDSVKSIFLALGANLAIAIAKLLAALFTGSGSMIAEAIHSFSDCGNQLLLLLGLKVSKRPPSLEHPLGSGKAIYFWSFIVALILFSVGGGYSIYEGLHKLSHPQELGHEYVAVIVLLFAIFAEGFALRGCIQAINKVRNGRSFFRWFRESRQSELLIIFSEDSAAILGLIFALVAVVTSWITGNPLYDAYGSIGIGVILIIVAFMVGLEVKALLIGQGVEPHIKSEMEEFLNEQEAVEHVYNLLTLQMGNDVMVAIKAKINRSEDSSVEELINFTEKEFKERFPQTMWLFFEPDLRD
ncbi:MAG: cation diffusion facilitator family transporter [Gammaproteobacteria bacterium]|nr:MAG: cation diffusion facilitator family transporter [Gammaproteobacteria bacterium]